MKQMIPLKSSHFYNTMQNRINDTLLHGASSQLPFGGSGHSGMGNYHGKAGFDTFSYQKAILSRPAKFDISLRYPPYKEGKLKSKLEGLYKVSSDWKKELRKVVGHSISPEDKRQAYANKNVLVSQDRIARTDKDKYDNLDYTAQFYDWRTTI